MSRKLTIHEMREIARIRGGKCLSEQYIKSKSKLEWQCEKGHIWFATPNGIKRGTWCRECSGKEKLTIEEMVSIARSRGGKCLSNEYINDNTPLHWECKDKHTWWATPHNVKNGSWCRRCYGTAKLDIEEMKKWAESKGGKCLSEMYVNNRTQLQWQCKYGHTWKAKPSDIRQQGTWCPECWENRRGDSCKSSIQKMQEVANSRGGKCLSTEYINSKTNLKWQCKEGHIFDASPGHITRGTWCLICTRIQGVSERICRSIFEHIFETPFPRRRPKWLLSPNNKRMELDGFSEKLGIAFEYQGEQHFHQSRHFHRSEQEFRKQLDNDKEKRELCFRNGVKLIEVPYYVHMDQIAAFVFDECKRTGISIAVIKELNLEHLNIYSRSILEEMQAIAVSRGGNCLSNAYLSSKTKLRWKCQVGHLWSAVAGSVKQGSWCPVCAQKAKLNLEEMKTIAESRGGKCLSKEYVNSSMKLQWQCHQGHDWWAPARDVKAGSWCRKCYGTAKLSIEEMRMLAESRGGMCLSERYINSTTYLKWQCKEGHVFDSIPHSVKSGTWCPKCGRDTAAKKLRLSINEMKELARIKGGECLSETYVNNRTKLEWKCKNGHRWWASPDNVTQGCWCIICAGKARRTIEEMRILAKSKGGKCLSESYKNNQTKLLWMCKEGHKWEATPYNVKRGTWCPGCHKKNKGSI